MQSEIQADYERLHAEAQKGDPQKAGHMGEETWKRVLSTWLPPYYEILTRRYMISETEEPNSGETDIVILNPSYPKALQQRTNILAGGIVAAFSVKVNLDLAGLREAIEEARASALRLRLPRIFGNPRHEMTSPVKFGLLCHTHSWKGDAISTVGAHIKELDKATAMHPRECIDYVCISDLASWACGRMPFTPNIGADAQFMPPAPGYAITSHGLIDPNAPARPVGTFISRFLFGLVTLDPFIAPWAWALRLTGAMGFSAGQAREWMLDDVFQAATALRLVQHGPFNDESDWGPAFL